VTGELPPSDVPDVPRPAPEGTSPEPPAERPRERNEDPLIPEVFRNTIPPPPKGWSEENWRRSFLGAERSPPPGQGLNFGKGWLLAVLFGAVAVVLVVLIVLIR